MNKIIYNKLISDIKILKDWRAVMYVETPTESGLITHLEHWYDGTLLRQIETLENKTLTLPMLSVPFLNNGVYRCISYVDNDKSTVSQNQSLVYEYRGYLFLKP